MVLSKSPKLLTHPSTNGLAEKSSTNCKERSQKDHNWLNQILTGKNSACILNHPSQYNWQYTSQTANLRTRLDLLKPNTAEHVESKQWNQKVSHDNSILSSSFTVGQSVLVCVYSQTHKWTHGSILKSTGPLS